MFRADRAARPALSQHEATLARNCRFESLGDQEVRHTHYSDWDRRVGRQSTRSDSSLERVTKPAISWGWWKCRRLPPASPATANLALLAILVPFGLLPPIAQVAKPRGQRSALDLSHGRHSRMEFPGFSGDSVGAACVPLRIAPDLARLDDCHGAFDCRKHRCTRPRRRSRALDSWEICFLIRSFFELLKKDSTTALSQQLPFRLILGSRRFERQNRRHASLPN